MSEEIAPMPQEPEQEQPPEQPQEPEKSFLIITSDGKEIGVKESIARQSSLLEKMLLMEGEDEAVKIPLKSDIFNKVLGWLDHHKTKKITDSVNPLTMERTPNTNDDFQRTFLDVPMEKLIELMDIALYLGVLSLKLYVAQKIAQSLKDNPVEKIREILHIENDISEEDKNRIRETNMWKEQEGI